MPSQGQAVERHKALFNIKAELSTQRTRIFDMLRRWGFDEGEYVHLCRHVHAAARVATTGARVPNPA